MRQSCSTTLGGGAPYRDPYRWTLLGWRALWRSLLLDPLGVERPIAIYAAGPLGGGATYRDPYLLTPGGWSALSRSLLLDPLGVARVKRVGRKLPELVMSLA